MILLHPNLKWRLRDGNVGYERHGATTYGYLPLLHTYWSTGIQHKGENSRHRENRKSARFEAHRPSSIPLQDRTILDQLVLSARKGATGQRTQTDDSYYSTSQVRGQSLSYNSFFFCLCLYANCSQLDNSDGAFDQVLSQMNKKKRSMVKSRVDPIRQDGSLLTRQIWCFSPIRFV